MISNYDGFKEETILNPVKTRFNIDCLIYEADNLLNPNKYDEYTFNFSPLAMSDHQTLMERAMSAEAEVMMSVSSYSSKVPKQKLEDNRGMIYCSQLWKPKVNLELQHSDLYVNRQASLTLHFRDAVDGAIYLQCEYLDVYQQDEQEMFEDDENGDFDF